MRKTLLFSFLSLRAKILKRVDPIPNSPGMPWHNLKIISSVEKDVLPEVYQLTSTENENPEIEEYFVCEAELEFKSSPHDPLEEIEVIEVLDVNFQVSDFVMDYGKLVHDYLGENKKGPVRESKNIGGKDACDR